MRATSVFRQNSGFGEKDGGGAGECCSMRYPRV